MKKILAFVLSASMCLSLLTALAPAFACEQDSEQISVMRLGDPDDEERDTLEYQDDNN